MCAHVLSATMRLMLHFMDCIYEPSLLSIPWNPSLLWLLYTWAQKFPAILGVSWETVTVHLTSDMMHVLVIVVSTLMPLKNLGAMTATVILQINICYQLHEDKKLFHWLLGYFYFQSIHMVKNYVSLYLRWIMCGYQCFTLRPLFLGKDDIKWVTIKKILWCL